MDYDQGYDSSLGVRLLTFTHVFSKYISLLFVPADLHMAYEVEPVVSIWSWSALSFAILGLLFGYLIIRSWKKNRLISFGLAWFLILLLPRTNIISINRPLYEHWLYLPMAGFWLAVLALVGKAVDMLAGRGKALLRIIAIAIFSAIIIISGALTTSRNRDWRDPITFYEKNLRYTPNSYIQHNNLGMAYAAAGRLEEAENEYRRSLALDQRYPQVTYNLGNVLASQGRLEEAEKEYHRSIGISSEFTLPYVSLIRLAIAQQDVVALDETILLMEKNFPPEYSLKQAFYAYYALGNAEKARVIGRQYLSLYPGDEEIGLMMLEMR
jgi:tetratricopeptide (TPR) repeat protein